MKYQHLARPSDMGAIKKGNLLCLISVFSLKIMQMNKFSRVWHIFLSYFRALIKFLVTCSHLNTHSTTYIACKQALRMGFLLSNS